ncbi:MAG: SUF system Fe-S cluster assembly protein [Planctomycetia bacterium]|nr:SUF system Fe-S cluster assembly protein [Planctomycetia bacterium]
MSKLGIGTGKEPEFQDDPELPMQDRVANVIKTIFDPEIPVNIYELGLIYEIAVNAANDVAVKMTLTSPACPVAGSLPRQVEEKIASLPGVHSARVELVWEPPWSQERMSEAARLELGFF